MHRVLPKCRIAASLVLGWALVGPGMVRPVPAQSNRVSASNPFGTVAAKPSLLESLSSGIQRGWDGLTGSLSPKTPVVAAPDPTSLRSGGHPSPRLHVEVARMNEHAGRLDEAEQHYQAALRLDRNDLGAMLNYARLRDRRGETAEAFELYRRATEAHPREASVYNHLGLHYDRRGMPNEAAAALAHAVYLKPDEALYRNNLAHVLVHLGRLPEAFQHLHAVHGEAVAYYNLGFLLHRRGDRKGAVQHVSAALRRDPNFAPARQLLAELAPAMRVPAVSGNSPPHVAAVPSGPPQWPSPPRVPASQAPGRGAAHAFPGARSSPEATGQPSAGQSGFGPADGNRRQGDRPAASPHTSPPPRNNAPQNDGLRPSLPQRPNDPEVGRPGARPLSGQSPTPLKQPEGLVRDEVRRNAPFIRLTGATVAIPPSEAESGPAKP